MDVTRELAQQRLDTWERRGIVAPDLRHAAVALTVFRRDGEYGIWVLQRPVTMRAHAGQFALPGGRVDAGETSAEAARREVAEEIGVALAPADVLGLLDDYRTRSGYVITPVICWRDDDPPVDPNPGEVAAMSFVTFADLASPARFVAIDESPRPVIQLPILGTLVHAPTAAVIYQFAEVVLRGRNTRVDDFEQPVFAWR